MTPKPKMPASPSTEQALLGALLFDGRKVQRLGELLTPDDFYDGKHGPIYAAMLALDGAKEAIDLETVADRMRRDDTLCRLAAFGQEAYLAELVNVARGFEPVESYAKIIRRCADLRRLILFGSQCAELGYRAEADFDTAYDAASRELLALGLRASSSPAQPLRPLVRAYVVGLEERYRAKQPITGVPSGFADLDDMTAGFQAGDLILCAARPSMGKTAFALQVALNATEQPSTRPALVFSLEMSKDALTERLVSSTGRVDSSRLRTGMLQAIDWVHLSKGTERLVQHRVEIDDTAALTMAEIRARARHWRARRDLFPDGAGQGLIIVDYLQLIAPAKRGRDRNREQEVAEISRGLKALAKELGVPVLALSQLNRGVDSRADKRPTMGDLRESGALEQDADVILFLYRDEFYNRDTEDKGIAEVILSKQRRGATGVVRLHFDGAYTRFDSLAERSAA